MSAGEALGAQFPRLFHGSNHDLVGDTLRPGVQRGMDGGTGGPFERHGQSSNEVVSATSSESMAWGLASASGINHVRTGRTRVYEVEPNEQTRVGIENSEHPFYKKAFAEDHWQKPNNTDEYVAPSFKVKDRIDIMPGRQGTLPIDWSPHASMGEHPNKINHPAPYRPAGGFVKPAKDRGTGAQRQEREAHEDNAAFDAREKRKAARRLGVSPISVTLFTDRRGEGPKGTQGALF